MSEEHLEIMREEIKKAVKETVNGKIDTINTKLDNHIEKVAPFLQGVVGIQIIWKVCVSVGSLAIAYLAIKNALLK